MIALTVLVGSVTEAALTVMVCPIVAFVGAVKRVPAPLAVFAALKVPAVAVHVTPAFAGSFVTTAVRFVEAPIANSVGGGKEIDRYRRNNHDRALREHC